MLISDNYSRNHPKTILNGTVAENGSSYHHPNYFSVNARHAAAPACRDWGGAFLAPPVCSSTSRISPDGVLHEDKPSHQEGGLTPEETILGALSIWDVGAWIAVAYERTGLVPHCVAPGTFLVTG
jgi:hypothetical protein